MSKRNGERLVIVIPAYNEEMNISRVVAQWHPIAETVGGKSRLLVINDGSTDGTQEKLRTLQKEYPLLRSIKKKNGGHGAAVLYGYRCALAEGADYVFQTDSDGQTLPEEFWPMWERRARGGLSIGTRRHRQDGWQRVAVTRVLRLVIRLIFGCKVEDANTPFRLMRADELREVLQFIPKNYFLSNVLMTVIYTKKELGVYYYPITFRPRQGGRNSINMKKIIRIGANAVLDFIRLRKKI